MLRQILTLREYFKKMKVLFIIKTFLIIFVCVESQADWRVSFYGGVVIQHLRNSNAKIYDNLLKFKNALYLYNWPKEFRLIEGTDYKKILNNEGKLNDPWGFINQLSCEKKLMQLYKNWKNIAKDYFKWSEGFRLSSTELVTVMDADNYEIDKSTKSKAFIKLKLNPVYLTNINYPQFKVEILRKRESIYDETSFYSPAVLLKEITDFVAPETIKILQSWDSATNPVTTKKNGLTLGLSGTYSRSLFPKASSTFGLYTGVEGFAEINPNESKSNGFSIKEKSFGIRPFVGIIKKDNWAIYALAGVKSAKRDIKSDMFHINKGKLSYEIGVGSDYILSERFSVSAKFIKGLKSKFNVNGLSFQTSSTKILFSLNYHF